MWMHDLLTGCINALGRIKRDLRVRLNNLNGNKRRLLNTSACPQAWVNPSKPFASSSLLTFLGNDFVIIYNV